MSAAGVRFWKAERDEKPLTRVYVGNPERSHWLADDSTTRFAEFLSISYGLLKARLLKKTVYWIPDKESSSWPGYYSLLLQKLLHPFKIASSPNGD